MDWLTLSEAEWTAIRLSLLVSSVAVAASLPLGVLVALALSRGTFWGKSLLNGIVHLPLILPPVVTGFLLLILFGRKYWNGSLKWMQAQLRDQNKYIGPADLKLLTVTDDVDEAARVILNYLQKVGPPQTIPMAFS